MKLVRLFSPEHGIRGEVDAVVPDGKDDATGLPIVSLYGKDRKPRARDLDGLDALVYDIQDIGARFYTYITTLGLVLEAAQESAKKVFVLDRPNPIGGRVVSGPVRDEDLASFIAYHALPVRHGMTVGELALLYNTERKIGASLAVVRCRGWRRDDLYDRTGLVWINPSPNMRSLTEALLYPGVGLLEATNLATGRGTDAPFERVGAPWIEPAAFAAALNSAAIPGARFVPIFFTPSQREYAGRRCGGVQILVTSWAEFDPLRLGVTLAVELRVALSRTSGSPRACSACSPTGPPIRTSSPPSPSRRSWRAGTKSWRSFRRSARVTCSINGGWLLVAWGRRHDRRARTWLQGRGVRGQSPGAVFVLDPGTKPLGCVRQSIRLQPGGVLIERLVKVFRPEERDVAVFDGKGRDGAARGARRGGPSGRGRRRARSGQRPICSGSRAGNRHARGGRST